MTVIEHGVKLTPDELQCLTCAMAGNFPERFAPLRMGLLRKLAKAERANTQGAVEALRLYGTHLNGCSINVHYRDGVSRGCDCGLLAAIGGQSAALPLPSSDLPKEAE